MGSPSSPLTSRSPCAAQKLESRAILSSVHMWPIVASVVLLVACHGGAATTEQRVDVGGKRLFVSCTGDAAGPGVVLVAGRGATTSTWAAVQPSVGRFARVCSYDRAGIGRSNPFDGTQTAAEIVDDLHQLLQRVSLRPPYVLVGHSIGGIYARRYEAQYPDEVSGLVFVDSSHEEQLARFAAVAPRALERERGPTDDEIATMRREGFLPPGEHLTWRTTSPLVVLERGLAPPVGAGTSLADAATLDAAWHQMQLDLAARSSRGQLRTADHSGHFIQEQQPALVVDAIRDVLGR